MPKFRRVGKGLHDRAIVPFFMRILFGSEHDARQIDPDLPGAYEWWYFDAVSDDGNFVFVAIFFLGTPMSPYYKATANGQKPFPKDWCGVFVSLHEKKGGRWTERAYGYNLYRGGTFPKRFLLSE